MSFRIPSVSSQSSVHPVLLAIWERLFHDVFSKLSAAQSWAVFAVDLRSVYLSCGFIFLNIVCVSDSVLVLLLMSLSSESVVVCAVVWLQTLISVVTCSVLLYVNCNVKPCWLILAAASLLQVFGLYFNSHFPGGPGPGLASTRMCQLLELRMMEVVVTTGAISRAKLQSNRHHQQTNTQLFIGQMPFLSPDQQCQSTEGKIMTHSVTVRHFNG